MNVQSVGLFHVVTLASQAVMIYQGANKIATASIQYRSYFQDWSSTSRNVGKCGPYFYFVSSDQKLVQIDTSKVQNNPNSPSEWEKVVDGSWSGSVEDFVIRKTTKDNPRGNDVDIAILTKNRGTVYEVTYNAANKSVTTTREIKLEGDNLNNVVGTVSYWNNIIEIEVKGSPSYIVNGYISTDNHNICISVAAKQYVKILSSSKLVSYRQLPSQSPDTSHQRREDILFDLQQARSVYRCVGTETRWNTRTDQRVQR